MKRQITVVTGVTDKRDPLWWTNERPEIHKIYHEHRVPRAGRVYFIGEENTPYVKVGRTEGTSEFRMSYFQTGNPRLLYIHRVMETDDIVALESSLHDFFEDDNIRGEWFEVPEDFEDWFERFD